MNRPTASRPEPTLRTKLLVWAAAAGRCTICNDLVTKNDNLGVEVPIGELAHIVGWSETSPRGASELDRDERRDPENLLLLCRNCHKPVDDDGVIGLFNAERLTLLKREQEERIRFLTEIGTDRAAVALRVVGPIGGVNPHLTYGAVLEATTAAGFFPQTLPGVHRAELDLDFRRSADLSTPAYFQRCADEIDTLAARLNDAIRRDEINRLAVFGFARIPVLVHLGARLDDKTPTLVFQRHRVDDANAWKWPETSAPPPAFSVKRFKVGDDDRVALVVCLSGSINVDELPEDIAAQSSVYGLAPSTPAATGPSIIDSPAALERFAVTVRQFLTDVERHHPKVSTISLFAAVPVSAAVTLGRVLMRVSPAWHVYDRDENNRFFKALEVRR